ncbi:Protein of unknown function [Bacillus cytotoxicus]|uniref:Uncharacterized protein n=1 Tax=Bacillus cytotoxicus TaxID=580165 RepID=A0AAX2CGM2_9BACI|nr:Protein of unknown function [Bacillus cytotoxicus]
MLYVLQMHSLWIVTSMSARIIRTVVGTYSSKW